MQMCILLYYWANKWLIDWLLSLLHSSNVLGLTAAKLLYVVSREGPRGNRPWNRSSRSISAEVESIDIVDSSRVDLSSEREVESVDNIDSKGQNVIWLGSARTCNMWRHFATCVMWFYSGIYFSLFTRRVFYCQIVLELGLLYSRFSRLSTL